MSSRVRTPVFGAAGIAIGLALPALSAAADLERGAELAYTCYGCHGIPNYKNVYPTYSVPRLEGQHADYLALALHAYRSGERSHSTMHSQTATLSDQDIEDIAAFLSGVPLKPGSPPEGAVPAKAKELCEACHGPDGIGITPQYPTLAGQHADYLERTLRDYRDGGRRNPLMAAFAADLSDPDIRTLAEYYAQQRPGLSTARHAMWFAQERKPHSR